MRVLWGMLCEKKNLRMIDGYGLPKYKKNQRHLQKEDSDDECPVNCPSKNTKPTRIGLQIRHCKRKGGVQLTSRLFQGRNEKSHRN